MITNILITTDPGVAGLFEKLGNAIEAEWQLKNFRYLDFPDIAQRCLRTTPIQIPYERIVRWALRSPKLPEQNLKSDFGQPPLRVYHSQRFFIEVLFWLEGTTAIHQHSFSGAFQVLAGSSIHAVYGFQSKKTVSAGFILGDLYLENSEYLCTGEVRQIHAGSEFIHSLFHLDHPSVSMVVRSTFEPESGPQYEYRTPFLAVDPFEDPSFIKRRLQLLELLHQTSAKIYFHELNNMIARSDFETAYFALRDSYPHVTKTLFRSLLRKAQKRHGSMFGLIAPVLEEEFRKGRLISLRQVVRNPEHRFFLALLLNLPNRSAILEFIRRKYSGNPNRWIKKWMLELTIPQSSLKDSNLIGIAWDDATDSMFRLMLSGQEFESILKQFEKIYSEAEVRRQQKKLIQLHSALRSSIFKPLFEQ